MAPEKNESGARKFEIEGKEKELPFVTHKSIVALPETLAIHLMRYDNVGNKLCCGIKLPDDGMIDLSGYSSEGKGHGGKYEITGYVVHNGTSLDSGHYTANVKIRDKYFKCDDLSLSGYQEISNPKEFYQNQQPYIILLKKI